MKRRKFLQRAALVAGSAAARRALASAWQPMRETPSARLILDLTRPLAIIRPGFLGLGYEVSSVARPGLLSRHNAVYVQLVRSLGSRRHSSGGQYIRLFVVRPYGSAPVLA